MDMLKKHQEHEQRVKPLLVNAIKNLCLKEMDYAEGLNIQGLIGITLDGLEVFLVSFQEIVKKDEDSRFDQLTASFRSPPPMTFAPPGIWTQRAKDPSSLDENGLQPNVCSHAITSSALFQEDMTANAPTAPDYMHTDLFCKGASHSAVLQTGEAALTLSNDVIPLALPTGVNQPSLSSHGTIEHSLTTKVVTCPVSTRGGMKSSAISAEDVTCPVLSADSVPTSTVITDAVVPAVLTIDMLPQSLSKKGAILPDLSTGMVHPTVSAEAVASPVLPREVLIPPTYSTVGMTSPASFLQCDMPPAMSMQSTLQITDELKSQDADHPCLTMSSMRSISSASNQVREAHPEQIIRHPKQQKIERNEAVVQSTKARPAADGSPINMTLPLTASQDDKQPKGQSVHKDGQTIMLKLAANSALQVKQEKCENVDTLASSYAYQQAGCSSMSHTSSTPSDVFSRQSNVHIISNYDEGVDTNVTGQTVGEEISAPEPIAISCDEETHTVVQPLGIAVSLASGLHMKMSWSKVEKVNQGTPTAGSGLSLSPRVSNDDGQAVFATTEPKASEVQIRLKSRTSTATAEEQKSPSSCDTNMMLPHRDETRFTKKKPRPCIPELKPSRHAKKHMSADHTNGRVYASPRCSERKGKSHSCLMCTETLAPNRNVTNKDKIDRYPKSFNTAVPLSKSIGQPPEKKRCQRPLPTKQGEDDHLMSRSMGTRDPKLIQKCCVMLDKLESSKVPSMCATSQTKHSVSFAWKNEQMVLHRSEFCRYQLMDWQPNSPGRVASRLTQEHIYPAAPPSAHQRTHLDAPRQIQHQDKEQIHPATMMGEAITHGKEPETHAKSDFSQKRQEHQVTPGEVITEEPLPQMGGKQVLILRVPSGERTCSKAQPILKTDQTDKQAGLAACKQMVKARLDKTGCEQHLQQQTRYNNEASEEKPKNCQADLCQLYKWPRKRKTSASEAEPK